MLHATLHIRLTRDCHAECDYCSSSGANRGRMSPDDFRRAIDFILDQVFPRLRIGTKHHVTAEYLGGDILVIPEAELVRNVSYLRDRIRPLVASFRDGAQSNLICSPRRALRLHDLFGGRIGTSWDPRTEARKVGGSAEAYRNILLGNLAALHRDRGTAPGRVMVLDQRTLPFLEEEVQRAIREGYDLVLRPVFRGGSGDIHPATPDQLARAMTGAWDIWRHHKSHRIEPFYSLYHRRKARGTAQADAHAGCPFQANCAEVSLSLDPDGSLYVCQEMADSGNYPLGNAIEGRFQETTWRLLARRKLRLAGECARCTWRTECAGGCMNEAILSHGDPFARTELCPVWKEIFSLIDGEDDRGDDAHGGSRA